MSDEPQNESVLYINTHSNKQLNSTMHHYILVVHIMTAATNICVTGQSQSVISL